MSFYSLPKTERTELVNKINWAINNNIEKGKNKNILTYFSDEDTYIRKTAYLAIGKIYLANKSEHKSIVKLLDTLFKSENE